MEFSYVTIIIFILSIMFLAFAIGLWVGRPKINSSKEKPLKKAKKIVKRDENNKNQKSK